MIAVRAGPGSLRPDWGSSARHGQSVNRDRSPLPLPHWTGCSTTRCSHNLNNSELGNYVLIETFTASLHCAQPLRITFPSEEHYCPDFLLHVCEFKYNRTRDHVNQFTTYIIAKLGWCDMALEPLYVYFTFQCFFSDFMNISRLPTWGLWWKFCVNLKIFTCLGRGWR